MPAQTALLQLFADPQVHDVFSINVVNGSGFSFDLNDVNDVRPRPDRHDRHPETSLGWSTAVRANQHAQMS